MLLSDYQETALHKIQVYGPPKSGKTLLVGKLAEFYHLYWLDLENGVKTLVHNLPKEWQKNITLLQLPDSRSYPIAVETVSKVLTYAPVSICEEHGKCSCPLCLKAGKPSTKLALRDLGPKDILVIDSGTQLNDSIMANITRGKPDDYKMERDDWGDLSRISGHIYSQIQAAPCNIVVITHETMAEMEDGKTQKIVPVAGSGNFSRNVAKYFDDVVYCQLKNGRHQFGSSTTYQMSIMAGSRTNIKLEDMKEPSLLPIFDGSLKSAELLAIAKVPVAVGSERDAAAATSVLNNLKQHTGGAK